MSRLSAMSRVLLLRSSRGADDPYAAALAAAGYEARCEPVLRFTFPRQETLAARVAHPHRYSGLICTSPRAVEALAAILPRYPDRAAAWQDTPAYAVGPRTAEALRALGLTPRGAESGTAEALAGRVVASTAPLLFLAGSRRRDALPRALEARGVVFEELVVYETHLRTDLDLSGHAPLRWVVFFSPSGVAAARQARGLDGGAVRKAALGPTTAAALQGKGWAADAVAAAPRPEALADALRTADADRP